MHDTLRCAQATNYDLEPCLEYIKRSVSWFSHTYSQKPSQDVLTLIKNHKIYIAGVNSQEKPVIFIDIVKMENFMDFFSETFIYLVFLSRSKMHIRSCIEGNIIVFDIGNLNSFMAGKFVKLCLDILERSFYGFTERIYFFNTGTGMNYTISTLKSILSCSNLCLDSLHPVTKELITIVSKENKKEALEHIGAHNLPVDLGGSYIKGYKCPWPTATPPIKGERITISILKKKNI